MTAYYVLGITFVLFAIGLFGLGMLRENFPPSRTEGRVLMAIAGLIAIVTFVVLVTNTKREHPREEAAEKAAEKKEAGGEAKPTGGTIQVSEKEYAINLSQSRDIIPPGRLTFDVANQGKVQHDLAIEGTKAKTPLIDPGKTVTLDATLKAGQYTLYCTVPGHEQLGMKLEVTVK